MKIVLRGKLIALSTFMKKIGVISHYQFDSIPESSRTKRSKHTQQEWRTENKLRTEINQLQTKITTQRIRETKKWFFEKINKIERNPYPNQWKDRDIISKLVKSQIKKET